jgi:hypothetical protein
MIGSNQSLFSKGMGFFVFCPLRFLLCGGLGKIEWVSNVFIIRIPQSAFGMHLNNWKVGVDEISKRKNK